MPRAIEDGYTREDGLHSQDLTTALIRDNGVRKEIVLFVIGREEILHLSTNGK